MKKIWRKTQKIRIILQKGLFFGIMVVLIKSAWIQYVFAATAGGGEIENPIQSESFEEVLLTIADAVKTIALYLVPVFIVIAGLQFLFAGESEEKIRKAKQTLWWTLIGAAIVVGATTLTSAVINTAQGL